MYVDLEYKNNVCTTYLDKNQLLETYISNKVIADFWMIKPSASLPTYDLKQQNPKAKDIRFCRE